MNVVVPLAGPDFVHPVHGIRPLFEVDGRPLILKALEGRPWIASGEVAGPDLTFVFRDLPQTAQVRAVLEARFPGCRTVVLSQLTDGALYSALAGAALAGGDRPLCVDLADMLFDWPAWPSPDWPSRAAWRPGLGGLAPSFVSDDPAYSYFEMTGQRMTRAVEKVVISDRASAGVYVFRDTGVFLAAAAHSIAHRDSLAHRGVLFVCPALNGVLAQGLAVEAPLADQVRPVGKLFH